MVRILISRSATDVANFLERFMRVRGFSDHHEGEAATGTLADRVDISAGAGGANLIGEDMFADIPMSSE